jgi:hypothetical protein
MQLLTIIIPCNRQTISKRIERFDPSNVVDDTNYYWDEALQIIMELTGNLQTL